jgi:hypothetical protein
LISPDAFETIFGMTALESQLIRRTLTDFFRDLLRNAMQTHNVTSSEDSEHYLVQLLERFAHPQAGWDSRPLALEYLEALQSPLAPRCTKLRHVADTSLFLTGIFMESLERQIVPSNYYMALGRLAYRQLADLIAPGRSARGDVFVELADRFLDFVRVLTEISFAEMFRSDTQTVRIYTRWLRTRSTEDAQWLMRHGIVPVDPGSQARH